MFKFEALIIEFATIDALLIRRSYHLLHIYFF